MRTALILVAALTAGCQNTCQALCQTMADFGNEECDNSFSEAEIDACIDDFASVDADSLSTCRTYGPDNALRREWSCDDVNLFRDLGGRSGDTDQ